jgi:hypothetical protein
VITLPNKIEHQRFEDIFTGQKIEVTHRDGAAVIPLSKVFSHCPIAILAGLDDVRNTN